MGEVANGAGQQVTYFGVDEQVAKAYLNSLEEHIKYVQEAGRKLGVPEEQLQEHDRSKRTRAEFPGYALHFQGGGAPDAFARAWLHHIHHNPHHWQHWVFPDGYTPEGASRLEIINGVVKMPEHYALEMVADWLGASYAYGGSWNLEKWLLKHTGTMRLHPRTAAYVQDVLETLGYRPEIFRWQSLEG